MQILATIIAIVAVCVLIAAVGYIVFGVQHMIDEDDKR